MIIAKLLPTEFATLLARCGLAHNDFAELIGFNPQKVTSWCDGQRLPPTWACLIVFLLSSATERSKLSALDLIDELEVSFDWPETLGVDPDAEPDKVQQAMVKLGRLACEDEEERPYFIDRLRETYERYRNVVQSTT